MDQVNAATKSTKEEAEPQRIKVCATQGRSCCSCAFLGCWRFVIIDQFWISDRLFLLLLHPGSLCVCVVYPRCVRVCRPCARADACVLDLLSSPRPENVLIAAPSKPPSSPPSKSHDNRLIIILHHRNTPITSGGGRNKNVKKKKRNAEPEAALTNFWNGTGRFFVISVLRCSGFADARKG